MNMWVPQFPCCWGPPIPGPVNGKMRKMLGQKPKYLPGAGPQQQDGERVTRGSPSLEVIGTVESDLMGDASFSCPT